MFYELLSDDILKGKCHFCLYESIEEMAELAGKCSTRRDEFVDASHSGSDWLGEGVKFNEWSDVQKKSNSVWNWGLEIYEKVISDIRGMHLMPPKSLKRKQRWEYDDGDELNLDRLKVGLPHLRNTYRQHRPGPINATIVTNVSANAGSTGAEVMMRGVAAAALTELMEGAGYRIELWAGDVSLNAHRYDPRGADHHFSAVRLKTASDPMDAVALVNATSAWYFRTVFFASEWVSEGGISIPVDYGLGRAGPIGEVLPYITPDEQAIICEDIWNIEQAKNWIIEQVKKLK